MTCKEKFEKEFPNRNIDDFCPEEYDYLPRDDNYCANHTCEECWDREIPEKDLCRNCVKLASTGDEKLCQHVNRIFTENMVKCEYYKPYSEGLKGVSERFENLAKTIKESCSNIPVYIEEPSGKMECPTMTIKDSGARREFATGAVRDIQEGKGRCDLLPLDVVLNHCTKMADDNMFKFQHIMFLHINNFVEGGETRHLYRALANAIHMFNDDHYTMFLEVSKHFEEGAKKYGEYNWQKGIPTHCYIDSAVRHYLKYLRGDKDEPHDRAFVWNILCCIWTCIHKPELNDYHPNNQPKSEMKKE